MTPTMVRCGTRFQAQAKGAAVFDRQEGMWVEPGGRRIYFDCTAGGAQFLGQVWEYAPTGRTLTLVYESTAPQRSKAPITSSSCPDG